MSTKQNHEHLRKESSIQREDRQHPKTGAENDKEVEREEKRKFAKHKKKTRKEQFKLED